MKTVFLDAEGLDNFELADLNRECSSLQLYNTTRPEEVDERIRGAELIIVNKVKISAANLKAAPSLKLICVTATGTDIVDLAASTEQGITVCNCQAYGTDSVVQHVFSMILALHTSLPSYHAAVQAGRWQQAEQFCFLDYPIIELKGRVLGIVGYGTLGRGIAAIAKAFGMEVLVSRRPGNPPDGRPPLEDVLAQADTLTLHCPLTPQTRNLIDDKALELMKPTSFLINCARGGIVDEQALVRALKTRKIAGAAIDVLSVEPPKEPTSLLEESLPNLLITPHIAWASAEARQRIIDQTVENIRAFKAGKPMRVV